FRACSQSSSPATIVRLAADFLKSRQTSPPAFLQVEFCSDCNRIFELEKTRREIGDALAAIEARHYALSSNIPEIAAAQLDRHVFEGRSGGAVVDRLVGRHLPVRRLRAGGVGMAQPLVVVADVGRLVG